MSLEILVKSQMSNWIYKVILFPSISLIEEPSDNQRVKIDDRQINSNFKILQMNNTHINHNDKQICLKSCATRYIQKVLQKHQEQKTVKFQKCQKDEKKN